MNLPWQTELSQMVIYFSPLSCVCSFCNCPGDNPIFIFNCGKHEKLTHSDTTESDKDRKKAVIFSWEQLDNLLHVSVHFSYFFQISLAAKHCLNYSCHPDRGTKWRESGSCWASVRYIWPRSGSRLLLSQLLSVPALEGSRSVLWSHFALSE